MRNPACFSYQDPKEEDMKVYVLMVDAYDSYIIPRVYALKERAEAEMKILEDNETRRTEARRLRTPAEDWGGDDQACSYKIVEYDFIE
jgi:hypothetical protein